MEQFHKRRRWVYHSSVPHPNGGLGSTFRTRNAFDKSRTFVCPHGVEFRSTTGEKITATQGWTRDGQTPTIVFRGKTRHGSACIACWGYRLSCNGSRIGQCAEPLDEIVR
jgi:hypothetical protein